MRMVAFVITIVGAVVGILCASLQGSIHFGSEWMTIALSVIGVIGGLLVLLRWRFAPLLLLLIAIVGIFPDTIIWEGAGSFFLVGALIGFSAGRSSQEA